MHGAALDRPRPHERHLDRQVLEVLGPRAQQHLHLRARLDLEHPDGVGGLDLGVRAGIVERGAREVDRLAARACDEVDAPLDGAQHAQAEQVDLEEAGIGARVLVPLAELPALHGGGHERHELGQRAGRDDHPAGVLGEVAGQPGDLAAEMRERPEAAVVGALAYAVRSERAPRRRARRASRRSPAPGGRDRAAAGRAPCRARGWRCASGRSRTPRSARCARGRSGRAPPGSASRGCRAGSRGRCRAPRPARG